jgi:hypothetical protein
MTDTEKECLAASVEKVGCLFTALFLHTVRLDPELLEIWSRLDDQRQSRVAKIVARHTIAAIKQEATAPSSDASALVDATLVNMLCDFVSLAKEDELWDR